MSCDKMCNLMTAFKVFNEKMRVRVTVKGRAGDRHQHKKTSSLAGNLWLDDT